jgi:hypothetical protein
MGDRAVRGGDSWTAEEALDQNVVDMLAPDLPTLLDKADGFKTKPKGLVLHTADAQVDTVPDEPVAADPRPADRPERRLHHGLDRPDRDHRRALEPGDDLPGHRRGDLARHLALRRPRCCP